MENCGATRTRAKQKRISFFAWWMKMVIQRRDTRELEALDDRLLCDMGITRDSLRFVVQHGCLD